jgi:guanylate kinase
VSGRRGIPFVVSAPSGTGKTTVCRALVERDPMLRFSVSHTTRRPRPGERDGVEYFFVDRARFRELVAAGFFLEHAEYAGNLYGTSHAAIDGPLAEGFDLLLEIEVQGAAQIRERRPDARFVFLLPPSREEVERRLRARGQDDGDAIARRLAILQRELEAVHGFDYVVVNDDLETCVRGVQAIVAAERAGETDRVRAEHGRRAVLPRLARRFGFGPA